MTQLLYDSSYSGFLAAVFEAYRLKLPAPATEIVAEDEYQDRLFGAPLKVPSAPDRAERLRAGFAKLERGLPRRLERIFHSEDPRREALLYHLIRRLFTEGIAVEDDLTDDAVLRCKQLNQKMGREIHRMHAFVRFQQMPDDLYCALVNPDFNVLPFLADHFVARYPAQHWLIYDTQRHYGLHYDDRQERTDYITLTAQNHGRLRHLNEQMLHGGETDYQQLWQTYFQAVDIPERRNLKLHLQHVPKRYWKYLTEKV